MERKIPYSLQYGLLLAFSFLVFYPSLTFPYLDIDELFWGEFANSVLNGCPPYVCVLGEKPPLLYLFFAGVFSIFGQNNYFAVHLIHIFWVTLTAFTLNLAIPGIRSYWPGFFYILLFGLPGFQMRSVTGESLMNFFLISSLAFFFRSFADFSPWKGLVIGTLIGLASLFRLQAGIQLPVYLGSLLLGFWGFFPMKQTKWKKALPFAVSILVGFILVWVSSILLLRDWGSWEAYRFWGLAYSLGYIKSGPLAPGVLWSGAKHLFLVFGSTAFFWILLKAGFRSDQFSKPVKIVLAAYLLGALIATLPGLRFYPHYFIQTFPPLALLASAGFVRLLRMHENWLQKGVLIGLTLSILGAIGQNLFIEAQMKLSPARDYNFDLMRKVGNYINHNTKPSEKIFVWGWSQGIYYFSDRRIGTRFISSDYLTGRVSASEPKLYSLDKSAEFAVPGTWEMFFTDLRKNQPTYFIDTSPAGLHFYEYYPVEAYPTLHEYLERHYALEVIIDRVKIYRLKPT